MWRKTEIITKRTGTCFQGVEAVCAFLNEKELMPGEVFVIETNSGAFEVFYASEQSEIKTKEPAILWNYRLFDRAEPHKMCCFLGEQGFLAKEALVTTLSPLHYVVFYFKLREITANFGLNEVVRKASAAVSFC
jgi:hypothetical protein